MNGFRNALLGATAACALVGAASAQTLTIGTQTETTSMDPMFYNWNPNHQIFFHVFNYLIYRDETQRLQAGLAESWKPVDDKVWELKLRKDAKWHDGSPFTADDVLFTVERSQTYKTPSPGGRYFFNKQYKKIDDHTIHITTGNPYPLMPNDLSVCAVVSKKHGDPATTEDYNSGKAVVGTGPYKFVEWVKGDRVTLQKDPNYWGKQGDYIPKPSWDRIVYKAIPADPARVAALLNGDVDLIDYVPTTDYKKLKTDRRVAISETASDRSMYFHIDVKGNTSPFVKANDGSELPNNPLRDIRVRRALSMAINRDAIVERVMEGLAMPAGQFAVPGQFGYNPDIKPPRFDPEGAKKLLAEAGYPDGFRITVHGSNDRYINDDKITEAAGQMLARIGLKVEVRTETKATYFTNAGKYSLVLLGFGTDTGEASSAMTSIVHTPSPALNLGSVNRGGYSNPKMDQLVQSALVELDDKKRERLLQDAAKIYVDDVAVIPLHYQVNVWAHKPGFNYAARSDEKTIGLFVSKK